jgi:hypothetical protein
MDNNIISLLPDDILWTILSFDDRFVFRNNKWIFISKIAKDDYRYSILQNRRIITKSYRIMNNIGFKIVIKQHKNISSVIIYDNNDISDIEFSHYLYKSIRMLI